MPKPAELATFGISAFKSIALQPALPAALLILLDRVPREMLAQVIDPAKLHQYLGTPQARNVLKIFLALGVARLVNRWLSAAANNNWSFSTKSTWHWQSELAVVTGGCMGIGRSIVDGLVARGVHVAILDVAPLPEDLAKISTVKYWKCDITAPEEVRAAADDIRRRVGHPSIVINNAGIAQSTPIIDTPDEFLKKIMGVNLMSLWYTTKEFMPNMILKDKGHIVTVASMASYVAIPTAAHYSATKSGALAFNEALKAEIKHVHRATGVLTTSVHPMWVATSMTAPFGERISKTQGKMMGPEDVARPVLKQIFSGKGGHVFAPAETSWISVARGLPSWMQETLRDVAGKE
ncbi:Short-chain dehydrogenase/reductase family 16C member-like protein [Emericellopsis cladophorae]|uniref:Short-chain dehydrogenase/reductase 3 n=1 Tax=Emericellopsis cladophorae TaxID=2686198 RepID=A0A9Q0BGR9_9HYPO|nr:Short-chain dehydrogenase/reductase family 16C member-like protein [Emericellopsis cladophorae]KAI6783995.1 Short-chain dehydrogenase/reductase family 16C member-like protein [Emericellopsis cladophorae]